MVIKCIDSAIGFQDYKRKSDHKYPRKIYSMIVNLSWKEMDKDCFLRHKIFSP